MTKADRLREMQDEINKLQRENEELKAKLKQWEARAKPQLSDFIKVK